MKKHFTMIMEENRVTDWKKNTRQLTLADGTTLSVQASSNHYCSPRIDTFYWNYESFEVGFPSTVIDELMPYVEDENKPTDTIYSGVPFEVIERIIEQRGGVLEIAE